MTKYIKRSALLLAAVAAVGCQDLIVENTNAPDRDRALAQADAVEVLVASTFPKFWARMHRGTAGFYPLSMAGDEGTMSANTNGARNVSEIPRIPFNNNPVVDDHAVAALYWGDMYEVLANAGDVLKVINDGLRITTGDAGEDNTDRARMFAKLSQGLALGYIGLLFDQAYIFDENTPTQHLENPQRFLELKPYPQVMARAFQFLAEAEELALTGPDFGIPADWLYSPTEVSRNEVVRILNAYAARFQVLQARSPAERASLTDWNAVLTHISKVQDDVVVALGPGARDSQYLARTQHATANPRMYAHPRLYGNADISGAYQNWLNTDPQERERFLVETPDRRLTGAAGPQSRGSRFDFRPNTNVDRSFGGYRESYYQFQGHLTPAGVRTWNSGEFAILPLRELRLYEAEARYRAGQYQQAADLINVTRVGNGQLPPVTGQGTVPGGAECVPRTDAGACGDLWDALVYERMMELSFIEPARTFLDRRGLGTLFPGTMIHLPIPGSVLEILGIPRYTFGGGGEGSAP